INTITTLVENKKAQLVVAAKDMDPIELVSSCLPCVIIWGPLTALSRERKTCTTVAFTQLNLDNKGALAKLLEAIRTNYNDRYDEIPHHWGDNILSPKSGSHCQAGKAKG
ncbi:hypothetical protein H8959_007967, partial [Pygathrix nigripes]